MKTTIFFPNDYVVLDLETTGFNPDDCKIIEIGILKVRNNQIVNTYSQLISINTKLPQIIKDITLINDDMLKNQPGIDDIIDDVKHFIGDDYIIGHNILFDISFLEKHINIKNRCIDTVRLFKKTYPDYENHKLETLCKLYKLPIQQHRALDDCIATNDLYQIFIKQNKELISEYSAPRYSWRGEQERNITIKDIKPTVNEFDKQNPFYDKNVVFTGNLIKYDREDVYQLIVNLGGAIKSGISKKVDYLIISNGYLNSCYESAKQKKAKEYNKNGSNIKIISENEFYKMLKGKNTSTLNVDSNISITKSKFKNLKKEMKK